MNVPTSGDATLRLRPGVGVAPASLRGLRCATDLTVFSATLSPAAREPYEDWLIDGLVALVVELRGWCGELDASVGVASPARHAGLLAVVVERGMTPPHDEAAEAFVEAVRGITQCVTLEYAHTGVTLSCVAVDETQGDDLAAVACYVGSEAGLFAAGASFELRALT